MSRRGLLLLLVISGFLSSCARKGYPPGGPVDMSPPFVVSTSPDSGRTLVELNSEISVLFSERMEKRTVKDWLVIRPSVIISSEEWKGNAFTIVPLEPLRDDTTYTVFIGAGARDSHGNIMGRPKLVWFSTGEELLQGRVTGRLEGKKLRVENAMLFLLPSGTPFGLAEEGSGRVSQADLLGVFSIPGLEPEISYDLYCLIDRNGNRAYDEDEDVLAKSDTVIVLDTEKSFLELSPWFVTHPKEPGILSGTLSDTVWSAGKYQAFVRMNSKEDTTRTLQAKVDSLGRFMIDKVPPGAYEVRCFIDSNGNGNYDRGEPVSEETSVLVKPEQETKVKLSRLTSRLEQP